MSEDEISHIEVLADLDALSESLSGWGDSSLAWHPARACRALMHRLAQRLGGIRDRLESPVVVATLGGTGVGKSALVNALVGEELVQTGRSRPTTGRPILVCRPDLGPETLGIDPQCVEVVRRELPTLASMAVIDCPDPDTTEATEAGSTNLARLRQILPHCDVLIVASTQQKYRSARVAEELAAAASGARLVFVQTHADCDTDIRDDWREMLEPRYTAGRIFLVDSRAALADAQQGRGPRGEFASLVDLLTRQLAGNAVARIRRANLLDLVEETLDACHKRVDEAMVAVGRLEEAIQSQRSRLAAQLAAQIRSELVAGRRQWESRLLDEVLSRWGMSPFTCLLRLYHGIGGLVFRGLILRARTPAQMALWGAVEGVRSMQAGRRRRQADSGVERAVIGCWDSADLRSAALVVDGFAMEAGIEREGSLVETTFQESAEATAGVTEGLAVEFQSLVCRAAQRHTGRLVRYRYEFLFALALVGLFLRPAKNFFYDSWLASPPAPLLGLDFYLLSAFWLAVWSAILVWRFVGRLRRGLDREIGELAAGWASPRLAGGVFAGLESQCRDIRQYRSALENFRQQTASLRGRLSQGDEPISHQP